MQHGVGRPSPINTTVIAFEEEWTHPTRVHWHLYVHRTTSNTNRIVISQAHMGADVAYT